MTEEMKQSNQPREKKFEIPKIDIIKLIESIDYNDDGKIIKIGNGLTVIRDNLKVFLTEGKFKMVSSKNPEGMTQASIDFTPYGINEKVDFGKQLDTMLAGGLGLLKLISEIESDNINIDYFIGQTNDSMAKFCTSIGFQNVSNFYNRVYVSKNDLVVSKKIIIAKLERILSIKKHKNNKIIETKSNKK
jgi:hypothetical protein